MRQFACDAGALQEKAYPSGGKERSGESQQLRKRCQSAGGDERGWRQLCGLYPDRMDADRGASDPGCLLQESGLSAVSLNQIKRDAGGERQNQAWEAAARPEINGRPCFRGEVRGQLQGVGDVPVPDRRLVPRRNQIDCSVPAQQ